MINYSKAIIDGGFFIVTIPYSFNIRNGVDMTTPTTPSTKIDDTKKKILELIENNEKITKEDIGKVLNMTKDGAKYHIKKLTEEGYIKYVGNPLSGKCGILKELN